MTESINALVDPLDNSKHEKFSRIKEAFLSVMDDSIAKHYYITGERGMPKRVELSQDLIKVSELKDLQACKDSLI